MRYLGLLLLLICAAGWAAPPDAPEKAFGEALYRMHLAALDDVDPFGNYLFDFENGMPDLEPDLSATGCLQREDAVQILLRVMEEYPGTPPGASSAFLGGDGTGIHVQFRGGRCVAESGRCARRRETVYLQSISIGSDGGIFISRVAMWPTIDA